MQYAKVYADQEAEPLNFRSWKKLAIASTCIFEMAGRLEWLNHEYEKRAHLTVAVCAIRYLQYSHMTRLEELGLAVGHMISNNHSYTMGIL